MTDKITQEIGIDATQALAMLARLDKEYLNFENRLDSVYQRLNQLNRMSGKAVGALKQLGTSGKSAASGVGSLGKAFDSNIPAANKSIDRLTTSFKLLSRVVFTQFIVRSLSQARNAFQSASDSAVKFEQQVARIQTIAGGAGFEQLAANVREISDAYNLTLDSTGAGVYQALSNQVGNLTETLEFSGKAAEFARATGSSLSASVDLLSSAIKSYGLEASDADKVAGIFFTTMERGRVKAGELSNAFGRVSTIAADLGVSLEEIGGSLASITVRGSKVSESLTQFRGIMIGLLKPSEKMEETLRELGFSSARSAITTLGFAGVLDALNKSTGGSAEGLAKLFPNVRGLSGVASLASDDLKSLTSNIREMEAAGRDFAKEKFLTASATDADRATKEINKLKNSITVDLGRSLLTGTANMLEWVGGADSIIHAAGIATPAIGGLAASLVGLKLAMIATRNEAPGLGKALGALALVPVAIGLGDSIGNAYRSFNTSQLLAETKELEKQHTSQLESFTKRLAEQRDAQEQSDKERLRSVGEVTRAMNKLYLSSADDARVSNDQVVKSVKDSLGEIVKARQATISELTRAIEQSGSLIEQSQSRVADLLRDREDRQFAGSISGFDDPVKSVRLAERAKQIAAQAAQELQSAVTPEAIQAALKGFDRARDLAGEASSLAAGNRASESRAAAALEQITDRQIQAERQMNTSVKDRIPSLTNSRKEHERILELLQKQVQIVSENVSVFDGSAILGDSDLLRALEKRNAALESIKGLSGVDLEVNTDSIISQVKSAFDSAAFAPLEPFGRTESPDAVNKTLDSMLSRSRQISAELDKQKASEKERVQINERIGTLLGSLDSVVDNQNLRGATQRLEEMRAKLEEARNTARLMPDDVKKIVAEMEAFSFTPIGFSGIQARGAINDILSQIATELGESATLEFIPSADMTKLQQEAARLDTTLGPMQAKFELMSRSLGISEARSKGVADNMERAAAASQRVNAGSVGRMLGGPLYRAAGGSARGSDSIAAMLSPGEFVMNARSANKFFPQLQAMNAGMNPTFRESGGSVTQTFNVGDINVAGGPTGAATGREIAASLKREMRRGSSRLK
ncbi:MAG: phage tail tape measure protein [Pirellulaceae bacterium]